MTRKVALAAIADAGIQGAELDAIGITKPAGDRGGVGPGATANPSTAPLSGRTAAPPTAATSFARPDTRIWSGSGRGLCSTPTSPGTKIEWLRRNVEAARDGAVFGTIDSWLVFKLTGRHLTDYSNASRTLLFDIRRLVWDTDLCELLGVDPATLPEPVLSAQVYGTTSVFGGEVPVSGIAGDQQAALFGHACFIPGHRRRTPTEPAVSSF